jgi:OFA family oxalate/formate antiporter-like MFS transporter
LGVLYAWGVMAKALVVQWHWSKADAALPFTVSTAAFAITMIFAGRLQDKVGPRLIAALGGIVLGLGLVASSLPESPAMMLVTFGIVGGIGIGLRLFGHHAACHQVVPAKQEGPHHRHRGQRGGAGGRLHLAAHAVPAQGDRDPEKLLVSRLRRHRQRCAAGPASAQSARWVLSAAAAPGWPPGQGGRAFAPKPRLVEMLRTSQFYRLWLMFILAASAGLMIIAHVAIIAKEQARWEWGFVPVVLLAIFNSAGRVASGIVSDRIGRTQTMVLAFVLQACNMFAFSHYTSSALLVFGSAFTGFATARSSRSCRPPPPTSTA